MDAPNLFGASNRSAPADRSPRPREAEGRLAPEMAESHEARSQAQAQRRAWPQYIATWAASGVAVPLAFFCTLFFRHRKKSVSAPRNGKFHSRAVVGASIPVRDNGYASAGAPKGFSLASLETFGHRSWRDPHGTLAPKPLPILHTISPGKFFFLSAFSIRRANHRLSSGKSPLSRRIRHLPFFPCMNPKNFL